MKLLDRLWKGLVPLWARQIPYTMMKFGAFENTVVALYKCVFLNSGLRLHGFVGQPLASNPNYYIIEREKNTTLVQTCQRVCILFPNICDCRYVVPKPKSDCSKGEQLGVSFAAGYIAGAEPVLPHHTSFCADVAAFTSKKFLGVEHCGVQAHFPAFCGPLKLNIEY